MLGIDTDNDSAFMNQTVLSSASRIAVLGVSVNVPGTAISSPKSALPKNSLAWRAQSSADAGSVGGRMADRSRAGDRIIVVSRDALPAVP
jgi:hypothetical protein